MYNPLQLREIFHLEFLRWFGRKVKKNYALKGGVNLRFFFKSFRYSEDMDLDIWQIEVAVLKEIIMKILQSPLFNDGLKSFGIEKVVAPDILKAKQTETTQRFKIHLITSSGEDLFTKIEFSRRGFDEGIVVEPVLDAILRIYKLPPLVVAHYNIQSTIQQKLNAIAYRKIVQARDIFDLYILSSQYNPTKRVQITINGEKKRKICENIYGVNFEEFRDTVLAYLSEEDQSVYNSSGLWDEVKLKVINFIEEL
ncbi:MAG: nucleotidyl transferase AbiEii/AbiGii toxin family protein [Candidatus Omnitrophica bacterium]|nr:nucleotidyl transferase AbiEii/AbiGii toxin family protein [Candidatus Omnitrophota bacterium]